jgi:hypothetical protein
VKTLTAQYVGDPRFLGGFSPGVGHTVTGGGGTTFTGPTATPGVSGTVTLSGGGAGCAFVNPAFVAVSPLVPPVGTTFPFGLFSFSTSGCVPGSTIGIQIVYSQPLPAGTQYWKYGPAPGDPIPHWYAMPGALVVGSTVTFTIQDGQIGDDDLAVNGIITDQGGPAVSGQTIPTMHGLSLAALALVLAVLAWSRLRKHDC